jgi:hypothetical protein
MENQLPQAVELGHKSVAIILSGDVVSLAEATRRQRVIQLGGPEPGLPAPINQFSRICVPHWIGLDCKWFSASGAPQRGRYRYFIGRIDVTNLEPTGSDLDNEARFLLNARTPSELLW